MNKDSKEMVYALISCFIFIPGAILSGFVIKTIWMWFICPLGVIPIGLAHAIGIDVLISFLTNKTWRGKDADKITIARRYIVGSIFNPLIFLGIAYVAHSFM